jgi:hypothetical protein
MIRDGFAASSAGRKLLLHNRLRNIAAFGCFVVSPVIAMRNAACDEDGNILLAVFMAHRVLEEKNNRAGRVFLRVPRVNQHRLHGPDARCIEPRTTLDLNRLNHTATNIIGQKYFVGLRRDEG